MFDGYYYEYDKQNKISAEKTLNADGTTTDKYSYEYDKLGQLVRFNDAVANKTYTYSYDSNGNILSKTEYAYTTGALGTATNTTTYGYDTQWKDKLVSVGDQTITYDNIGNPTSYLGATLTWEGRNLTSYEDETQTVQYEYDENGMRYRATVTNKEDGQGGSFEYVWVDGKLISTVFVSDGSTQTAKYLYNDFDEPVGMVVTDEDGAISTYYYLKNAQGDITNIVSAYGGKMVEFTYDAFGNKTAHYQANASTLIGMINLVEQLMVHALTPFSYRGYCYDQYTGLYYLQSRYYDPVTGRFINADDTNYLNATGTVLGCNLFAYCENDPVNKVDPKGTVSAKDFFDVLKKAVDAITGIIDYIHDLYKKDLDKLERSIKLLTKKQLRTKKNIKALINQCESISKKLGKLGRFITAATIILMISSAIKYPREFPNILITFLIEKIIDLFIFGITEIIKRLPRAIPGAGYLVGLACSVVAEVIMDAYFTNDRINRITKKFIPYFKKISGKISARKLFSTGFKAIYA